MFRSKRSKFADQIGKMLTSGRAAALDDLLGEAVMPHCDARVLHAPGECEHCDRFPQFQRARVLWGIAFSGQAPTEDQPLMCPADVAVAEGRRGDYTQWGGNLARR